MKSVRAQEWRPAAQGKATSAMQVAAGFWTFEKKAAPLAKRGRGVVNEKATSLQVRSQNYLALSMLFKYSWPLPLSYGLAFENVLHVNVLLSTICMRL